MRQFFTSLWMRLLGAIFISASVISTVIAVIVVVIALAALVNLMAVFCVVVAVIVGFAALFSAKTRKSIAIAAKR